MTLKEYVKQQSQFVVKRVIDENGKEKIIITWPPLEIPIFDLEEKCANCHYYWHKEKYLEDDEEEHLCMVDPPARVLNGDEVNEYVCSH